MVSKDFNEQLRTYVEAVQGWDRVHRIVGKTPVGQLVAESVEALETLWLEVPREGACLVDVGAGAGLLGFPALFAHPTLEVLFVEPDTKKAAFLRFFATSLPEHQSTRIKVLNQNIQDVSRETLQTNNIQPESCCLCARAFSGSTSLEQAMEPSVFAKHNIYIFRSQAGRHFFEKGVMTK